MNDSRSQGENKKSEGLEVPTGAPVSPTLGVSLPSSASVARSNSMSTPRRSIFGGISYERSTSGGKRSKKNLQGSGTYEGTAFVSPSSSFSSHPFIPSPTAAAATTMTDAEVPMEDNGPYEPMGDADPIGAMPTPMQTPTVFTPPPPPPPTPSTIAKEFKPALNSDGKVASALGDAALKRELDKALASAPKPPAVPTPKPTAVPTPKPTAVPTPKSAAVPTPKSAAVPTPKPTAVPTPKPTAVPTPKSTAVPTPKSTAVPATKSTVVPTPKSTADPTPEATADPTPKPTTVPTTKPTADPTPTRIAGSTPKPTAVPTPPPTPKTKELSPVEIPVPKSRELPQPQSETAKLKPQQVEKVETVSTPDVSTWGATEMNAFDNLVYSRYACTRFLRNDKASGESKKEEVAIGTDASPSSDPLVPKETKPKSNIIALLRRIIRPFGPLSSNAPSPNVTVVQKALHALHVAQRSPTSFNAQPYRVVLVSDPSQREALSQYCTGRNSDRVRDSDCTAVFLADCEWGRDANHFRAFLWRETTEMSGRRPLNRSVLWQMQLIILVISSGYPIPRLLGSPLSFLLRTVVSILGWITARRILIPTLASAETWSSKNTMLVAMTYMLGCTSRGLATCPMEGFDAAGVRSALKIPRRFSIPLMVSTGLPYCSRKNNTDAASLEGGGDDEDDEDDMGVTHGSSVDKKGKLFATPRYPPQEVIFANRYGDVVE